MACNCKRVNKLGQYMPETPVETSWLDKLWYMFLKVFYGIIIVVLAIVIVPMVMVSTVYQLIVKEGVTIKMPKFLIKYLENQ